MTTVAQVDIQKAIAWIDEHWKGQKTCPICANTRWGIADTVGEVQMMDLNKEPTERVYPLIILTCHTCGYAVLFNATVIGMMEKEGQ